MTRNLEKRVELMIPITEAKAKRRLTHILKSAFEDNQNAYIIQNNGSSVRKKSPKAKTKQFRLQAALQKDAEKEAKKDAYLSSTTFEPHKPI